MRPILHPDAEAEYLAEISWYAADYPGRGDRFFDAAESVIARIGDYSVHDRDRKSPRLNATMLRELQERVKEEARRRGLSFSAALSEAAELWLNTPPLSDK